MDRGCRDVRCCAHPSSFSRAERRRATSSRRACLRAAIPGLASDPRQSDQSSSRPRAEAASCFLTSASNDSMRAARAMGSSSLNWISGATRSWSCRARRERRCDATLSSPSNVACFSVALPSTLTYTRACRRSGLTSAPVTVTKPTMRGSFADSVRKVATSTRTASATRSARRVLRRSARRRSQCSSHLFLTIALEHVTDFDVVEVLHSYATLESLADFLDIVLESAQRRNVAVVNLDAVAHDANAPSTIDDPAPHRAPRYDTHLGDLEQLAHLGLAEHDLALFGTKHALQSG